MQGGKTQKKKRFKGCAKIIAYGELLRKFPRTGWKITQVRSNVRLTEKIKPESFVLKRRRDCGTAEGVSLELYHTSATGLIGKWPNEFGDSTRSALKRGGGSPRKEAQEG